MTPRIVGGIAAATFAIGILTGAAGTIVARDATTSRSDFVAVMADHMDDQDMGSMMSGSTFGPGMMRGPAGSIMPGSLHDQHHPTAIPDGAK